MSQYSKSSRLLDLPWELRRPIIVQVLRRGRKSEPAFNRKLIESRVRLRNCFDDDFPKTTNLYVQRHKNRYLHGNALRTTNRQLRYETNLLIEEEIKSGNIEIPFVLDVMIVKDVGVFPTWMSFPYRPEHLKMLTINLRIVRPGTSVVPDEWIKVARYEEKEYSRRDNSPANWNIIMDVAYMLSVVSHNKVNNTRPPKPNAKKLKFPSIVPNAYLLPSASYVADKLFIDFKEAEYDVNNKPIPPGVDDSRKKSPFYKEGYIQFGREVFEDYSIQWKDNDEIEEDERLLSRGTFACYQLEERLCGILCEVDSSESKYLVYLRMLARSVGELRYSGCEKPELQLVDKHPSFWTDMSYALDDTTLEGGYTEAKIEHDLIEEMDHGCSDVVDSLRTIQIRRCHGWVKDDD
ncbi:Protein kinase-like domain protein, partial [Metarhizium hybridum]